MKAGVIFTGTGPILVLATYESFKHPNFKKKLAAKGIKKFIAYELSIESVREKYGAQFNIITGDLHETDDLRVLDYDGHHVFYSFSFEELGEPVYSS